MLRERRFGFEFFWCNYLTIYDQKRIIKRKSDGQFDLFLVCIMGVTKFKATTYDSG